MEGRKEGRKEQRSKCPSLANKTSKIQKWFIIAHSGGGRRQRDGLLARTPKENSNILRTICVDTKESNVKWNEIRKTKINKTQKRKIMEKHKLNILWDFCLDFVFQMPKWRTLRTIGRTNGLLTIADWTSRDRRMNGWMDGWMNGGS